MKKRIASALVLLLLLCGMTSYAHGDIPVGQEITKDSPYYKDLSAYQPAFNSWVDLDTEHKQQYALEIARQSAKILEVDMPPIHFVNIDPPNCSAFTNPDTGEIYINNNIMEYPVRVITSVSHEMRHVWQLKYARDMVDNYIQYDTDVMAHEKQSAEIDANKFGALMYKMIYPKVEVQINSYGTMRFKDGSKVTFLD